MLNIQNKFDLKEKAYYTLSNLRGIKIETSFKTYQNILKRIKNNNLKHKSDTELKAMGYKLKQQARAGFCLDSLLPETFALICEICFRVLNIHPFDVQLLAALVLHQGKLAQMQTGEGKTLAAVFPACLNALTGRGIHILTANDYLARRDALWMEPIYSYLGLKVGYVQEKMSVNQRKKAYQADITYLTAQQAGFDFLRDSLSYDKIRPVQRDFNMVIVDEADFILIDQARIPLVLAGPAPALPIEPYHIDKIVRRLKPQIDYSIDKNWRRIHLTLKGQQKVQRLLNCGGIHEQQHIPAYSAVVVALHAHKLLTRNVDYIVRKGKIELVDEFTGRVAHKRRWPYGIQNALQAKEGLKLQTEGRIYGSITIQHFINLYPKISALTATAGSAAAEFNRIYGLGLVIIPTHRPVRRIDHPDVVFTNRKAKIKAVVREIKKVHTTGRPILVGTHSVRESQELAAVLKRNQISCRVLNAKNDAKEAELIAKAGKLGAVTISTNMAGRGTDIKLGGEQGIKKQEILALGGLYVIGTNRHESVRIDNQLRGRAGRQGDPGLSHFFISLEDELFVRYGIKEFIPTHYLSLPSDEHISDKRVLKEIVRAQSIIEDQNGEIRYTLNRYSMLVEKQRKYLQSIRAQSLKHGILTPHIWQGCREHFTKLTTKYDEQLVKKILIHIHLYFIDQFWADHLCYIEDLKEGIHLQRLGRQEPLLEFIRMISNTFALGLKKLNQQVIKRFNRIEVTKHDLKLATQDIEGPAGTWTYLVNDNPLPSFNVVLFANRNIGYAVFAAIPLMVYHLLNKLFSFLRQIYKKIRKKS